METSRPAPSCDLFCTVVDNFGDIGVCWRLARQLADEHGFSVRLWVDELATFQAICPAIKTQDQQWLDGVDIRHWQACSQFDGITPADIVVEGFACAIPPAYLGAMSTRTPAPTWLNLEYLSAEPWVTGYHGLSSVEPRSGLTRYFFFPGFAEGTGGLLRESSLLARRDAFQQAPATRQAWLRGLGIEPATDALLVSLFAYENSSAPGLLSAMAEGEQPLHLLVPQGRVSSSVASFLGQTLEAGTIAIRGALSLQAIPFLSQADYDQLLWSCDLNCVRGEDSLVRALWAGKPLLWHIYPQQDDAHIVKLEAFLKLYTHPLPDALARNMAALWLAWNRDDAAGAAWPAVATRLPELHSHARNWASRQAEFPDLASKMVQFCAKLV